MFQEEAGVLEWAKQRLNIKESLTCWAPAAMKLKKRAEKVLSMKFLIAVQVATGWGRWVGRALNKKIVNGWSFYTMESYVFVM
jgi:hypothetical protein